MQFFRLLYKAGGIWFQRDADIHAAALAYFVPFALTPLLLLSITIVGLLIGGSEVVTLLLDWGNRVDPGITALLDSSVRNFNTITTAYVLPIIALFFFSTMIVIALNSLAAGIEKVSRVEALGWGNILKRSGRSLLFVVLLQVYLVCIILLKRTIVFLSDVPYASVLEQLYPALIFSGTLTLFVLGYGLLPVRALSLKARFYGAIVASGLFFFTREIVALHSATTPIPDLFGAAGLVIVMLVWIYVSASIILYGAAFATAYEESQQVLSQAS